jgi:hypothetical protein
MEGPVEQRGICVFLRVQVVEFGEGGQCCCRLGGGFGGAVAVGGRVGVG